jgi:membrane protease subunit HflK
MRPAAKFPEGRNMPWSNQSGGGGWKGGNGGPWGQGPRSGGGPTTPDLEELLRRSQDRLKRVLPGGGGTGGLSPFWLIVILVVGVAFLGYNFFTFRVQPDELGIVLRFGAFDRQAQPGLNFRLPYPVDMVYTPKVTRVSRVTVGQVADDVSAAGVGRDIPEESLMLTGDENIVDIDFAVFWVINNAEDFLFNIQNPEGTVKAVAESAMREIVGRSNIQPILTQARQITETAVQQLMQTTLDAYGAGVQVTQLQLLKVDPPAEVIDAFRDVQAARADQERIRNEAQTYSNRIIPEARGQASQITEAANAYRDRTIAESRGQADRFTKVLEEYEKAPGVTRRRIFLETMESVLGDMDKIIVDEKASGTGVVPFLPLNELTRPQPGAAGGGQ